MELVKSLGQHPEEINNLDLIKRILFTLDYLHKKNGVEYDFAEVQSLSKGGSCYPRPKNDKPASEREIVLGRYDRGYFEQRERYLTERLQE